jgi:hypothetical protein
MVKTYLFSQAVQGFAVESAQMPAFRKWLSEAIGVADLYGFDLDLTTTNPRVERLFKDGVSPRDAVNQLVRSGAR